MKLFWCYLLIITAILSGCAAPYVQINDSLYLQGRSEEARINYQQLIVENPDDSELRYHYARLLFDLGEWEEAHKEISIALASDPFRAKFSLLRGKIFYYQKNYFEAINSLRATLQYNSRLLEGYYFLGLSLEKVGKASDALRELQSAIFLESLYFDAQFQWVRISAKEVTQTSDYEPLLVRLRKVLLLEPDSLEGNLLLAKMENSIGHTFKARKILDNWLTQQGPNDQVYFVMAEHFFETAHYEEALKTLDLQSTSDFRSQILRLEISLLLNKVEDTRPLVKKLIRENPLKPEPLILLSLAELKAGDVDRAELAIKGVLGLDSFSGRAHYINSQIQMERYNFVSAKRSIERALEIEPGNLDYQIQLFRILMDQGLWYQVPPLISEMNPDPLNPKMKEIDAELSFSGGDYKEALSKYIALGDETFSEKFENKRAALEILLGRYEEAETRISRVLDFNPQNFDAILNQVQLYIAQKKQEKILPLLEPHLGEKTEQVEFRLLLADYYLQEDEIDKSIELLSEGLSFWRINPDYINTYTLLLGLEKRYEEAIALLEESQDVRHPHRQLFWLRLAEYYYALEETEQFKKALNSYNQNQ